MRITFITAVNLPSKWAHTIQVMKMAQAFKQIGHNVELITACSFKHWRNDVTESIWDNYGISTPFMLTRLPLYALVQKEKKHNCGRFSYGYLSAILAKRRKTDLLFARDYLAPYWSAKIGIPTIAETHAEPDKNYQKQKLYVTTKLNTFKALVTISEILAKQYIKAGVPEDKVIVEQDGVDLSAFSSINEEDVRKTKKDLLRKQNAVALYAGHLYDYKGIPLILNVARSFPDVSFVLVGGWNNDIERIRKSILDSGLKNLILTGFVPNKEIPMYLKAADILLLPYSGKHHQASTTSPLKLFEYMAAKRPIVASAIGNVMNVLVHNHNSFLFNPDDEEGFFEGIMSTLSNKNNAVKWAHQAHKDVQRYDWRQRCRRIIEFAGY